jgi:O-antigen/teichoic acid export membrane protein
MRRSFAFNVAFLIFVNLLVKPFWVFGIDRTVQNNVGEAAYGAYFAVFNFTYIFQIFLDFGLQQYCSREIGANNALLDKQIANLLFFKGLASFVYVFITAIASYFLGYFQYDFICLLLLNQVLLSLSLFLRSNISAHRKFITDALLSVLDKLIMIAICAYLIWSKEITLYLFVLAQTIAYVITCVVSFGIVLSLTKKPDISIDTILIKNLVYQSLPYAAIHFLMTIYYRIDGVMIEKLLGHDGAWQSGVYAQGYRIMESLNNIGYLLSTILLPLFAYNIAKKLPIHTLLKNGFTMMFLIVVVAVVLLFTINQDVVSLLYKGIDLHYSSKVFGILLFNFIPVGLLYVISTLLTAAKEFRFMLVVLLFAVVINVVLNFMLIKKIGALGAAYATLVTQFFLLFVYSIKIFHRFKLSIDLKYALNLVGFAFTSCAFACFLQRHLIWYYIVPIFCVFSLGLSFVFGLVNKSLLALNIKE